MIKPSGHICIRCLDTRDYEREVKESTYGKGYNLVSADPMTCVNCTKRTAYPVCNSNQGKILIAACKQISELKERLTI